MTLLYGSDELQDWTRARNNALLAKVWRIWSSSRFWLVIDAKIVVRLEIHDYFFRDNIELWKSARIEGQGGSTHHQTLPRDHTEGVWSPQNRPNSMRYTPVHSSSQRNDLFEHFWEEMWSNSLILWLRWILCLECQGIGEEMDWKLEQIYQNS